MSSSTKIFDSTTVLVPLSILRRTDMHFRNDFRMIKIIDYLYLFRYRYLLTKFFTYLRANERTGTHIRTVLQEMNVYRSQYSLVVDPVPVHFTEQYRYRYGTVLENVENVENIIL